MRMLFEIDLKNYEEGGLVNSRPSVRGIVIRDNKLAMIYSKKFKYYKFPGGGISSGETHLETLCREMREEGGFEVIVPTVREFGYVHRIQKDDTEGIFVQDNYYYFCEIGDSLCKQELDDYESFEEFTPEWVSPHEVLLANRLCCADLSDSGSGPDPVMTERECLVIKTLEAEGYLEIDKG